MPQPDLTTVPQVNNQLRAQSSEGNNRAIQDYIRIASRLVRRATNRRFTVPKEVATRAFRTRGYASFYVDELMEANDLISVVDEFGVSIPHSLDFHEDSGPVMGCTITLGFDSALHGIRGLPHDHADNFIRELRYSTDQYIPSVVKVTATYGYAEVEDIVEDVEFATRRAVSHWFGEEIARYTDDAFISRGRQFNPEVLPPMSMALLRDIRADTEVYA